MWKKRSLLLLSNSTLHPTGYLEYAKPIMVDFLLAKNVKKVLFVPYALRDHESYAATARIPFEAWGFQFQSIHAGENPLALLNETDAIFIGGGNTFQLLKSLYDRNLIEPIRKRVLEEGIPYIGSSAGTNVATLSINTTNDMPIVYPPSFQALGLVPFNINPHFLDHDPNSTHKGETRAQRIRQYQLVPGVPPVVALREGSILHVEGNEAVLKGQLEALLFRGDQEPKSFPSGTNFNFLFSELESQ